jgi:hypothetical protein
MLLSQTFTQSCACLHPLSPQVIFRHLFEYKYSSMELAAAWQGLGRVLLQHQRAAARDQQQQPAERARQHAEHVLLRSVGHKLLHLVQEYVRYMCQDVLEPLWQAMEAAMGKAANLDVVRGLGWSGPQWAHSRCCCAAAVLLACAGSSLAAGEAAAMCSTGAPLVLRPCVLPPGCGLPPGYAHTGSKMTWRHLW